MNWQDKIFNTLLESATPSRKPNQVRRDISAMLAMQSHDVMDQAKLRNLQRELRDVSDGRNEMTLAADDIAKERRGANSRRKERGDRTRARGRRTTDLP